MAGDRADTLGALIGGAQMVALAAGETSEADFAAWLRGHLPMRPSGAVNEPRAHFGR